MRWVAIGLALTMAACSTTEAWTGGDQAMLARDMHDCQVEAEARMSANLGSLRYRPFALGEYREECMMARGWHPQTPG